MSFENKYKSTNGSLLFKPLFWETSSVLDVVARTKVLYTLKDEDYKGYPSLKRLYLEEGDLTEYSFAIKYFHDLDHWERLCDKSWFRNYIMEWRRQLELKIRSQSLKALISLTENPSVADSNPSKVSINKFLAEGGWRSTRTERRKNNRETTKVEQKLDEVVGIQANTSQISSDYDRILKNKVVVTTPLKDLN